MHAHSCNHYFLADSMPLISPGPLPSSRQYSPKGIIVYQILLHPSQALDSLPLQQCHMENTVNILQQCPAESEEVNAHRLFI